MEELKVLAKEIEDMKEAYKVKAKNVLVDNIYPQFFAKHPEIKMLYWTQYTPYFNDGDPCLFSVGEVCISDDVEIEDYYESYLEGESIWDLEGTGMEEDFAVVASFINDNEDLMQELYGDHSVVKVMNETPVRVDVEEYDHD